MSEKVWKAAERRVAALFGSRRTPLSGGNGKQTRADTLHPRLYVETKYRAHHAVLALFDETAEKAKAEGKIPVVALVERSRRGAFLVLSADPVVLVAVAAELCSRPPAPAAGEELLERARVFAAGVWKTYPELTPERVAKTIMLEIPGIGAGEARRAARAARKNGDGLRDVPARPVAPGANLARPALVSAGPLPGQEAGASDT